MVPVSPIWILLSLSAWALYLLPGFALARLVSVRRDLEAWAVVAWGLVGMGGAGLIEFWATFASPYAGRGVGVLLPLGSAAYLVVSARRHRGLGTVRPFVAPVMLSVAYSFVVSAYGFLAGIDRPVFEFARFRFSHPLPVDNTLPYVFASDFWPVERTLPPHFGDILSSDRPP